MKDFLVNYFEFLLIVKSDIFSFKAVLCLDRTDRHVNGCKIEETAVSVSVCLFPSVECQSPLSAYPLISVLSTWNVQMPKTLFQFPVFKQIVSTGFQGCWGWGPFLNNLINPDAHSHTFYNDTLFVWTVAYQWRSSSFCLNILHALCQTLLLVFVAQVFHHILSYIVQVQVSQLKLNLT